MPAAVVRGGGELHPWQPSSINIQIIECTKLFKPLPPNRLSKSSMKVFLIVSCTGLASYPGLLWAPGNEANTGHCQSTCMTHSHFFPHNLHCLSSFSPYILIHQSSSWIPNPLQVILQSNKSDISCLKNQPDTFPVQYTQLSLGQATKLQL